MSVTSRTSIKTDGRIELIFLARMQKEICVPPKVRIGTSCYILQSTSGCFTIIIKNERRKRTLTVFVTVFVHTVLNHILYLLTIVPR